MLNNIAIGKEIGEESVPIGNPKTVIHVHIDKPETILTKIINLDAGYFPFSPKNVHTTQEL